VKLFYYEDPIGNFGDDLNAWLWPRLIPDLLDGEEPLFVGIGSILDRRIPQAPQKVVFGTGVGYGLLPVLDSTWHISCVRGPLTAKALGLPRELIATDPAALVGRVLTRAPAGRYDLSFIPHFRTPAWTEAKGLDLESICAQAGINYINPSGPVEDVLDALRNSGKVIAEAMHGAIVADALRVPWVPVQLSERILRLKWYDWCGSLGLNYEPLRYEQDQWGDPERGITHFLQHAAGQNRTFLSADRILQASMEDLVKRLDVLRLGEYGLQGSERFKPDATVLREVPWLFDMQMALVELDAALPLGSSFILVDEEHWGGGQVLAGRHTIPFLEREGAYWGLPADSFTAVRELERLKRGGARYLALMQPSFWWLDFYSELRDYLRIFPIVAESTRIKVFDLSTL
jgi:succinoglycan biosynthesis protein ExoV